jgi:cytoskeleton protein RodZ
MQSIGERLEEARKRRGISVREASEATKIRGDFLLNFENNQFEVGLPDIYVRGFLRNYSSFLKIDPEKIVTDFNATLLGETKANRKDSRELFGRLEIPERPRPSVDGGQPTSPTAPRRRNDDGTDATPRPGGGGSGGGGNPELGNYLKIGLIAAAGIATILAIVWLVMLIVNATHVSEPRATPERSAPAAENPVPGDSINLVALNDVWVKVTQVSDNVVLFDGQLARGEKKAVTRHGAVRIGYNAGTNLQVEVNGLRYKMTSDGIGFSTIP